MNELVKEGDKRMTVKEVAAALGVDISTIQKRVRELWPEAVENGRATYLNEVQVTMIKQALASNAHLGRASEVVSAATTDFERKSIVARAIQILQEDLAKAQAELEVAKPKIVSFNALMRSEQTMSITDAAKHFGLHPKTHVFPYLRDRAYLTKDDMPSQDAIDAGYLALRETKCPDGTVRKQAVVLVSQLETWRTRVVPQVKRWATEGAMA